eukprot:13873450-Alexandrium_andersonii.AAC.1
MALPVSCLVLSMALPVSCSSSPAELPPLPLAVLSPAAFSPLLSSSALKRRASRIIATTRSLLFPSALRRRASRIIAIT